MFLGIIHIFYYSQLFANNLNILINFRNKTVVVVVTVKILNSSVDKWVNLESLFKTINLM